MDHLLLHCAKTRMLWDLFFSLFGTTWVTPDSMQGTLMSLDSFKVGKRIKRCDKLATLLILEGLED